LSEGGALLALLAPLTVGDVHDFALDLDAQTIRVQGRVRRCQSADPDGFRVGVEFVHLDPAHERLLKQYLTGV
jgi:c-di-GMP-binding flagellar brake protein YcgR